MVGVGAGGHWKIDGILTVSSNKRSKLPMSAMVKGMLGMCTCVLVYLCGCLLQRPQGFEKGRDDEERFQRHTANEHRFDNAVVVLPE